MIIALVLTWIVPSGNFQTEMVDGREMIIADSFTEAEEKTWLSPLSLFTVVPRALADAQGIIFFIFIIGGALAVIRETGAIDAFLGKVISRFKDQPGPLIFFAMFSFTLASATLGMAEEYIPFAIILISLCVALNLDSITAIGTMVVGYGIGYGVAFINPFTVMVAQDIAQLQPGSGIEYRAILSVPFLFVGFHHVWKYAKSVQKDPANSLLYGIEENHYYLELEKLFQIKRKIKLLYLKIVQLLVELFHQTINHFQNYFVHYLKQYYVKGI
jgi:uncharacterized ion transporter superfamily protein YfcC